MATTTNNPQFFTPSPISVQTYTSGPVDFYTQALDLGTQTGVEVTDPEDITELEKMGIAGEDGGGGDTQEDALRDISATSLTGGSMLPGGTGIEYNKFDYTNFDTYSSYLESEKPQGWEDRIDFTKSLLEPLVDGRLSDIDFSAATKSLADRVGATLTEKPTKSQVGAGIGYAVAGTMGSLVGSAVMATNTRTNAFGNVSARPDGILGVVADAVHATQYQDMAHNRAVQRAFAGNFEAMRGVSGDFETDEYGNPLSAAEFSKGTDFGFSMAFGSGPGAGGITRKAGTAVYTGNMRGLDNNTLKNIEAVQRGFVPSTFGWDYTGKNATTFEDAGYSGAISGTGGRYTENGGYMDRFGNYSMMGSGKDLTGFAKDNFSGFGLTTKEMENYASKVLSDTRAGKGKLQENLNKVRESIEAAKAKTAAEAKAKAEAEAAARAQAERERYRSEYTSDGGYEGGFAAGSGFGEGQSSESVGGRDEGGGSSGGSMSDFGDYGGYEFNKGGKVPGYAPGGEVAQSGFIDAPPSQVNEEDTVADDRPDSVPEGTYILNAAAVEFAGEQDIRKMLMDAQKEAVRRGIVQGDGQRASELVDIAVSSGEVKIAPHLVDIIGEDRLEKINKRGLRKTEERIQQKAVTDSQGRPVTDRYGKPVTSRAFSQGGFI